MEKNTGFYFRIIHRYLGFYLVGIMAVYAISGIAMIFRNDDTFKISSEVETTHIYIYMRILTYLLT